jgi:ATP-dependent Clp protease protease subunit
MNKLLALYRANRGKGEGFRALAEDGEPCLMVYDVIVSSDADAEWLGGCSAESFVRALGGMNAPRVHVHINSPGGDAFAGMAMGNAIRNYPGEVVCHVDGIAASAAGFLVASAPQTIMALGAMIMVHKSWTIAFGNSDDMLHTAGVLEKVDAQQIELFRTKNAEFDWEAALAAETWFTADEAMAAGLATEKEGTKPPMALAFDLSAFEHAPQLPVAAAPPAPGPEDTQDIERRRRIARAHELANHP